MVQQRAGRVRNPLGAGVAVVQDPALEAEAERMGLRAASAARADPGEAGGCWTGRRTSCPARVPGRKRSRRMGRSCRHAPRPRFRAAKTGTDSAR